MIATVAKKKGKHLGGGAVQTVAHCCGFIMPQSNVAARGTEDDDLSHSRHFDLSQQQKHRCK